MGRSHTCTPSLWLVSCARHPVWLMWVWLLVETGWKVSFSSDSFSESTFIHTLQCLFTLLCVQHAPRSCVYITFANVTNPMSILTALQRHKEFYHEKCNTKPEEEEEEKYLLSVPEYDVDECGYSTKIHFSSHPRWTKKPLKHLRPNTTCLPGKSSFCLLWWWFSEFIKHLDHQWINQGRPVLAALQYHEYIMSSAF